MDSFIYIDGWVLWAIMGLVLLIVIMMIVLGQGYFNEIRKNDRLKLRIASLKEEKALLTEECYRHNFTVPEIGEQDHGN